MKQETAGQEKKKKSGGIPTWGFALPIALILVILHTMVGGAIATISRASSQTTETLHTYSAYMNDVTDVQANSSRLSETMFSFVLRPLVGPPDAQTLNLAPLYAYISTLKTVSDSSTVLQKFEDRDIGDELMEKLTVASQSADTMIPIQLHAIALVFSAYPPDVASLSPDNRALLEYLKSRLPAVSDEEKALSEEQRLSSAVALISGQEYSDAKKLVSENVSALNQTLQTRMTTESEAQQKRVNTTRTMLLIATFSVITTLLVAFILLIRLLIVPLRIFVRGIDEGKRIPAHRGLAEVRLVASSYNSLMRRKNALENVLRSAAETDTLTGLPNRYHMEQFILQEEEEGCSAALFVFDVNYLKKTNDRDGHSAGDALLQRAAKCISLCFEGFADAKCFRYGGDEFVAIMKNCSEEDVAKIREQFEEKQKTFEVSIAVGSAFSPDVSRLTVKELFDVADGKMYKDKKRIHEQDNKD